MKLQNILPLRYQKRVVRRFGQAQLVKLPNGQHELIGGSEADRAEAFAWTSLFAHEIVFTHQHRDAPPPCRSWKSLLASRFVAIEVAKP
jgi:hypothetical protein